MRRCQVGDLLVLGAQAISGHLAALPEGHCAAAEAAAFTLLDAIFCASELDRPQTERLDHVDVVAIEPTLD